MRIRGIRGRFEGREKGDFCTLEDPEKLKEKKTREKRKKRRGRESKT